MSKIHVLDEETINHIAAGEVVERAASVVKELVENAVDAKATKVTIDIASDANHIKRIAVTDDGVGVSFDDAILAFRQHATSKIERPDDLGKIVTLGFRGEALASIAAVSKVTFTSKERNDNPAAVQVVIHGGELIRHAETGAPDGTTIVVEDLFYNTPARRKFQRTVSTELSHIYDMVERIALAHLDVSFVLLYQGRERFRTYGTGSYPDAIAAVFGSTFAKDLLPVELSGNVCQVKGWISKPGCNMRPTATRFYLTINSRQIASRTLQWAIRDGYGTLLPKNMYPAAFLDITLDAEDVDVNVHPTKREVRLSREREVASFIRNAVHVALHDESVFSVAYQPSKLDSQSSESRLSESQSLESHSQSLELHSKSSKSLSDSDSSESSRRNPVQPPIIHTPNQRDASQQKLLVSEMDADVSKLYSAPKRSLHDTVMSYLSNSGYSAAQPQKSIDYPSHATLRQTEIQLRKTTDAKSLAQSESQSSTHAQFESQAKSESRAHSQSESQTHTQPQNHSNWVDNARIPEVLGQIGDTYIAARNDAGDLVIIDQHAAHERVMYDKLLKKIAEEKASQELLTPVTLELSRFESARMPDVVEVLSKAGYIIEPFGHDVWAVRAVPVISSTLGDMKVIHEIISETAGLSEKNPERVLDRVIKTIACRAVIKGNTPLTKNQMERLLSQLNETDSPYTCPHGRPTSIVLTKEKLASMFLRT